MNGPFPPYVTPHSPHMPEFNSCRWNRIASWASSNSPNSLAMAESQGTPSTRSNGPHGGGRNAAPTFVTSQSLATTADR